MNVDKNMKEANQRTTIHVTKLVQNLLKSAKNPGQTYNGYIKQLLRDQS